MRTIALYNRQGQRLLTLREAQKKGYGLISTLRKRIHRRKLRVYKVGQVSLVPERDLTRQRPATKGRKRRR